MLQPTYGSKREDCRVAAGGSVSRSVAQSIPAICNVQRIEPLRTSYAYVPGRKTGATDDEQVAVRDARSYVGDGQ
jgi:hypothetical protein